MGLKKPAKLLAGRRTGPVAKRFSVRPLTPNRLRIIVDDLRGRSASARLRKSLTAGGIKTDFFYVYPVAELGLVTVGGICRDIEDNRACPGIRSCPFERPAGQIP